MDELDSLGYLGGTVPASSKSGVTIFRPALADDGLNLLTDGHRAEAILMDMKGHALYRWRFPFEKAFPDAPDTTRGPGRGYWRRVALLPDGGLLGIYEGQGLVRIDRDSRLVWAYPGHAHHDLEVLPDGTIYVLTRKAEILPSIDPEEPVLDDYITVLGPDGRERRRISIVRALQRSPYTALLDDPNDLGDFLHTNTLEILDGRLAGRIPAFARGNVLISMASIDTIAVVDMKKESVVWAMRGLWDFQHAPTVLENGRLLVFDNQGDHGYSRVFEIDPVTQEIPWLYSGAVHGLYSETCGTEQRLPNGNTLITESDNGRALEVTAEGETVWEYYTPYRAGDHHELIATLFEVLRLPRDRRLPFLPAGVTGPGEGPAE